ncbi:hypothetical protein RhiirA1_482504 [Rhizophagus irregularis]|uniref:AMP-dependent synthetase/ligase domain-containing protein n=1 Tax=Rhizophagus irregularis TaxID=588596 RepID=A0A2N0QLR4_9GLOM|nr:hypothetical protein RhiirA1_482504 [Rhizophagus irregularis]
MVLLNRKLSKEELDYQIKDAKVSVVIVDEEDEHLLPQKVNKLPFLKVEESHETPIEISEQWTLDQTTSIMYTSGTTGYPKGVRQTVADFQF